MFTRSFRLLAAALCAMAPILVRAAPYDSSPAEPDAPVAAGVPAAAPSDSGKAGLPSGSFIAGPIHRDASGHIVASEQKPETCDRAAPVSLPPGRRNVDILLLGASIAADWNREVWQRHFGEGSMVNAGIDGWTTSDVLTMLSKDGLKANPRLIILLAISNDLARGGTPLAETENIRAIMRKLCTLAPASKVLLLGVLPRGEKASDPLREKIREENLVLAKVADSNFVYFLDVGSSLLDPDGSLPARNSEDHTHLTAQGYELLATALQPTVERLLGKFH
jgi:beta-glucosidase